MQTFISIVPYLVCFLFYIFLYIIRKDRKKAKNVWFPTLILYKMEELYIIQISEIGKLEHLLMDTFYTLIITSIALLFKEYFTVDLNTTNDISNGIITLSYGSIANTFLLIGIGAMKIENDFFSYIFTLQNIIMFLLTIFAFYHAFLSFFSPRNKITN